MQLITSRARVSLSLLMRAARLPSSRPPIARLVRIQEALQDGEKVNTVTMANELEVSTKTIQRDVTFMRDQLELPISWDYGSRSFKLTVRKAH